jgi:mono/diheme cytochrome c family protein
LSNTTDDTNEAKKLYDKHCKSCHLDGGTGDAQKKNKPAINNLQKAKDADLIKIIKEGKKGEKGKMQGFAKKLNDNEIKLLINYIKSFDQSKK